jgi:hypothetical protein
VGRDWAGGCGEDVGREGERGWWVGKEVRGWWVFRVIEGGEGGESLVGKRRGRW